MVTVDTDILGAKILIVDDQESEVMLLEQMLSAAGYTCIATTRDPRAVTALHRDHHYDLILLDLQMPGMDGFQVMESLQTIETYGYLPVLAITAQPAHKLHALQGGAKDFVSKPFDLAEVLMRVHNMLEVRLLHKAARNHGLMLESLALNDPLTGLANRRLLTDRISLALAHARRNQSVMAVLYLDLDGFKQVNDTLGHSSGDDLLKLVAGRLVATVREEDTAGRQGGDEFVIVLWQVGAADDAAKVADKVIKTLSQPYALGDQTVQVTASAGIAIYPVHGKDAITLLKNADRALHQAKAEGKNAYCLSEEQTPLSGRQPPA